MKFERKEMSKLNNDLLHESFFIEISHEKVNLNSSLNVTGSNET